MTIDYKNANPYHLPLARPHVPNPIIDDAYYMLEHYYVNILRLKQPKLMFLEDFGSLRDPTIVPSPNDDLICYTYSPMIEHSLYHLFMYAIEHHVNSVHVALIVHADSPTLIDVLKQSYLKSLTSYNRMKHNLRRFLNGERLFHSNIDGVLKQGIGLGGTEYIPRQLPELILNTDIHVFEHPGVMIL